MKERKRRVGRRSRRVTVKHLGSGLLKASAMLNGEWVELTNKVEIENEMCAENLSKFFQTNNTPSMVKALVSELGFLEDSEVGVETLNGACEPPHFTDKNSRTFIKVLVSPPHPRNRPQPIVPMATFSNGWKKMREDTSAGMSKTHFGNMTSYSFSKSLPDFESTIC